MNILLVNDDGISSKGLRLLCERLSALSHNLFVVAPHKQRSGYSHSLTMRKPFAVHSVTCYKEAVKAFTCSGTPADCAKFALQEIFKNVQCDLVISGPNKGENVGYDMIYSGTVAGAEEGAMHGIKSIALSKWGSDDNFESCVDCFVELLPRLLQFDFDDCFLNVNFPDCDSKDIKGIRVARQGGRVFNDYYEYVQSNKWQLLGEVDIKNDFCDADFSYNGYVTVTPVAVNRTCIEKLKQLEEIIDGE